MSIIAFIFVVVGLYACVKKEVPMFFGFVVRGKPAPHIGVALIVGGLLAMTLPMILRVMGLVNNFVGSLIVPFAAIFGSALFVTIIMIAEKRRQSHAPGVVSDSPSQLTKIIAWNATILGCVLVIGLVNDFVGSPMVPLAAIFDLVLFITIIMIAEKRRQSHAPGVVSDSPSQLAKIVAWSVTILGCILITGTYWADVLDPLIFNAKGEYRTDGIFRVISPLLDQISMELYFGLFKGLPFLFIGVAGLVFLYGRTSARLSVMRSRPFASIALAVVVLTHVIVFGMSVQFFLVPAGSAIRPMGWAMFVGIVSFWSLLLAEPASIVAIIKEKPRFLGIIGMIGGIMPFFFSSFILHLAARIKGFELEP